MFASKAALMFVLGLGMAGATSIPAMAQGAGVDERFDPAGNATAC